MSKASQAKRMIESIAGYSLMSVPQVADVMGVSPETVHEMIDEGVLPSVPVGRRLKVDPIDVAVHVLAAKEAMSPTEYRERYGPGVVATNARRWFVSRGMFMGAA